VQCFMLQHLSPFDISWCHCKDFMPEHCGNTYCDSRTAFVLK
jgi:hypothetical protein